MSFDLEALFNEKVASLPINTHCPECNAEIQFTLAQVGTIITCPNCDSDIELNKK